MRSYEGSAVTQAGAEGAWAVWVDVAGWTNGGVIESARLNGEFEVGSTITSKVRGFPQGSSTITRVEPHRLWVNESRMPGVRLVYEHLIEPIEAGTMLTERALISGPLAGLIGRAVGRRLESLFEASTAQVARQAEEATDRSGDGPS